MLQEIMARLNWVDIIVLILIFRILYVSAKNGFVVEFFKLAGIIFTIYISLHYYSFLSNSISSSAFGKKVPLDFLDMLVFCLLAAFSYSLFVLLRKCICHFIKMEAVPVLSKWGGFILGFGRGVLTASFLIVALFISTNVYFESSVKRSYSGKSLFEAAVNTYSGLWNGLASKFSAGEEFNKALIKKQEAFNK